jgi:hypothetical protein
VSRPIVMCHEMSQYTPARMQLTDATDAHTNHDGPLVSLTSTRSTAPI